MYTGEGSTPRGGSIYWGYLPGLGHLLGTHIKWGECSSPGKQQCSTPSTHYLLPTLASIPSTDFSLLALDLPLGNHQSQAIPDFKLNWQDICFPC